MKKQEYISPALCVVELQHQQQLLINSITEVSTTNLNSDDEIIISQNPLGEGVWGR